MTSGALSDSGGRKSQVHYRYAAEKLNGAWRMEGETSVILGLFELESPVACDLYFRPCRHSSQPPHARKTPPPPALRSPLPTAGLDSQASGRTGGSLVTAGAMATAGMTGIAFSFLARCRHVRRKSHGRGGSSVARVFGAQNAGLAGLHEEKSPITKGGGWRFGSLRTGF